MIEKVWRVSFLGGSFRRLMYLIDDLVMLTKSKAKKSVEEDKLLISVPVLGNDYCP